MRWQPLPLGVVHRRSLFVQKGLEESRHVLCIGGQGPGPQANPRIAQNTEGQPSPPPLAQVESAARQVQHSSQQAQPMRPSAQWLPLTH
jgi:hypothetical protein